LHALQRAECNGEKKGRNKDRQTEGPKQRKHSDLNKEKKEARKQERHPQNKKKGKTGRNKKTRNKDGAL
jgi:hypothetical protein